jgi:cysteine-rich repeat protein
MKSSVILALIVPGAVVLSLSSCAALTDNAEQSSAAEQAALCGNGVRDPGEQCDDGNVASFDGCSATCGFEQVQRMNSMQMVFATDSLCTSNALGGAVGSQAQSQLQQAIGGAVTDGTVNVLFSFEGLSDPTGLTAAPSLSLGSFVGTPMNGVRPGVDAWYTIGSQAISASGTAATTLPAQISNGTLTAGPGNVQFALSLGGDGKLAMSGTRAKASIGSASVPTTSTGSSPGHVAGEHLDPALKAFGATASGELCGNVSAASFANIPAPSQLTSGSTSCGEGYSDQNSLLDVLVGGCTVFIVQAFKATQPDKTSDAVPAVGAGGPYKLTADSDHKVSGCKDKSGASVSLSACLDASAYSAGFKFTSQRAIIKGVSN